MLFECPENLKLEESNKIYIEEDAITIFVNTIETNEENVIYKGLAVIDDEKYHDFSIDVTLTQTPENLSFETLLDSEWEFYDLIF
ncbi:MAG: hypothetical protein ACK5LV_07345 [Lachnospirales bacterium]